MIAWTSSFPWKCELSLSPPKGAGESRICHEMAQALDLQYLVPKAPAGWESSACIAACRCEYNPLCTECLENPVPRKKNSTSTKPIKNFVLCLFWVSGPCLQYFSKKSCCCHRWGSPKQGFKTVIITSLSLFAQTQTMRARYLTEGF